MSDATAMNAYRAREQSARERLILEHLSLVQRIARAFAARTPPNIEADDLVSAGTLGLTHAEHLRSSRLARDNPSRRRKTASWNLDCRD